MNDYMDSTHTPWLPRHRVFSLNEDIPYAKAPIPQHMTAQSQADICAHVANSGINKAMGRWARGFQGIKRP